MVIVSRLRVGSDWMSDRFYDGWGSIVGVCWSGVSDWMMDCFGDNGCWGIVSIGRCMISDWSGDDGLLDDSDSWCRSVNDSVESVDGVSGVGDSSDGTVRFDKGVLALDDISVAAFVGAVLVPGEGVRNRVSVVVLWVRVIWLWLDSDSFHDWLDGLHNWSSISLCNHGGVGVSDGWGGISVGRIGWSGMDDWGSVRLSVIWRNYSTRDIPNKREDDGGLDHFD